jgi:ribosomal protein S18 acetylase RimI-like enzyme
VKLSFRTLIKQDIPIAHEIVRAAYGSIASNINRYPTLQPNDWLLALADDAPVGLGGATHYSSFSYIGMLGVLPSMQHYGIGRAIMEALLQRVAAMGIPTVLLDASNAGVRLYTQLGFVEDDKAVLLQRDDTLQVKSSGHDGSISPIQESELPDLGAFDAPLFGAERAHVLASYLTDYPQRSFMARDANGAITGFLITQSNQLGPWMAINVEVAEQLLTHALTLPYEKSPVVIIPAMNQPAKRLLQRYGFTQQRALVHMRLGPPVSSRDRHTIYGQASFAIG